MGTAPRADSPGGTKLTDPPAPKIDPGAKSSGNRASTLAAHARERLRGIAAIRHSLAMRLLISALLFSACVTLILTPLRLYFQYRREVSDLHKQLDQIQVSDVDSLAERLWAFDQNQLQLQLTGILRLPNVRAVEVRGTDNQNRPLDLRLGEKSVPSAVTREFPLLYNVGGRNTRIGTLYVRATRADIYRGLFDMASTILVGQATEIFLLSLFILYIFHHLVTRHLLAIASFVGSYRINDPPPPLQLRRRRGRHEDELQRVVTAFNALSDNLQATYRDLRDVNNQLTEDIAARRTVETVLREREARIRRLIDADIIGIFLWDVEGPIFEANDAFLRMIGYDREDLLAGRLRWTDLTPPESRDLDYQRKVPELTKAARLEPFEKEYARKDGSRVPVLIGAATFEDNTNQGVAFVLDLSERKRAEEARQEIEEQWRAAFESNPTMYFIVDEAGVIVSVNPFGARQLGYTVSELVGRPVSSIFYEQDRPFVQGHAGNCLAQPGRMQQWEARKIKKDGTMIWVRETGNAVFLKKRLVLLVVCEDITEQKHAEEAARRGQMELRDVVNTIPVNVWSAHPDGSIDFVNQRTVETTVLSKESALGLAWASAVHPDDLPAFIDTWRANIAAGNPLEDEVRVSHRDGTYHWSLIRIVPQRDEFGNIIKWYGSSIDIEDRKRAEEAARRSEKELRDAIESVPAILFVALPGLSNVFVSRGWREYTGLSSEDTAGFGWQSAIHPEDMEHFMEKWRTFSGTGEPFEDEVRCRRAADGEYRWFLVRAVALRDESGAILKWYGILTDIEDRRRAEDSLRATMNEQTHLAAVREEIGFALARKDSLRGILQLCVEVLTRHLNVAFARIWTATSDGQMLELQASAGMYTRLDGSHSRIPFGHLKIGLIAQERKPHYTNDVQNDPRVSDRDWAKRENMISFAGYPLAVEDRVVGVIGMFSRTELSQGTLNTLAFVADGIAQGIERKRAEDALRRSEKELRELIETIPTLAFSSRPDGSLEFVNRRALEFLGWTTETSSGERWQSTVHPDDIEIHTNKWHAALMQGQPFENEVRHRNAKGEYRWFLVRAVPLRDEQENILKWYGVLTDIEDRKRAETERERLRQLQADLAHINRVTTLGELTASLSHELKQPIAAAITNARTCLRWLMRDEPRVHEAREAATRIVEDGTRAASIIDRLRAFYRKGVPPEREAVDVNALIQEMRGLLRSEAHRYSVSVHTDLAPALPIVAADRVQLQQVLMNLMLNGMEAMKDTGGELSIRSELGRDGSLLISVSDTGVGLPTEKTDEIFSAFFTTKPQGSGMGLAISRSIVESHGGRLWASANSGPGAVFYLTLPIPAKVD